MRKTKEWLVDDIHIFRNHYLKCDKKERIVFRRELGKYEELKERIQQIGGVPYKNNIIYRNADDLFEKEVKPYKVTCDLSQCDDNIQRREK